MRLRKTPALLAVLEALLHVDRPYGLEIIERTGLPSGTVYPLLARLEAEGWASSLWEGSEPGARGARKRFYEITPRGAEQARAALVSRRRPVGATKAARPSGPKAGLAGE